MSRESGNVVWFHSENRSADDLIIKGLRILRFVKHNVSRTFNLLDRPCIAVAKGFRDRAVASGKNIQNLMKTFWVDAVRKFLRSLYIGDFISTHMQTVRTAVQIGTVNSMRRK